MTLRDEIRVLQDKLEVLSAKKEKTVEDELQTIKLEDEIADLVFLMGGDFVMAEGVTRGCAGS